jgi:dTDP-4-amino-4,6-dideoxygalactose transaminase
MATIEQLALTGGPKTVPPDSHQSWPEIRDEDRAAVLAVLDRGVMAGANSPEITALQREYADYVGVEHCLAVNTGTAALHCCAVATGMQPGDEVIIPAYTFVASAMAMLHHGTVPVFCDVDPRTYNLDPARIEERLTDRTRAIVAVHIHGQPADMDEIVAIARRRELAVIEDVAQAHGGVYRGRKVGTIGDCAGTSLNQSKNLSAGEGGLFLTNDDDAFKAARRLSVFGEDLVPLEARAFWSHGVGWNYRNQELSSAFARTQLRRLDEYNERAEANGRVLTQGISEIRGITPPYVPEDRSCSYWKYMIQLDPEAVGFSGPPSELRDRVLLALQAEGVEAIVWQPQPIPAQPVFRKTLRPWQPAHANEPLRPWDPAEFPVTSRLVDVSLALGSEARPLYVQEAALMQRYVEAVEKVMNNIERVLEAPFSPIRRIKEID